MYVSELQCFKLFVESDTSKCRIGWENSLGLSPYNKRFRTYRKNMSKIIGSKVAAAQFNPLQEEEVGHFLVHLLEKPQDLTQHIKRCASLEWLVLAKY